MQLYVIEQLQKFKSFQVCRPLRETCTPLLAMALHQLEAAEQ
jgi:hypothetical protein